MKLFRVRIEKFEYDTYLALYILAPNSEKALEIARVENPWIETEHLNNNKNTEFMNNVKYWEFNEKQKDNLVVEEIKMNEQKVISVEDNLY